MRKISEWSSERADSRFEVAMCDGVDYVGFADLGKGYEADRAGFEFFIAAEFFHDSGGGDGIRQCEWEVEVREEFEYAEGRRVS